MRLNISKWIVVLIMSCMVVNYNVFADTWERVFILASYEKDNVCGGPQESGIIKGLNKEGWFEDLNMSIEYYYMDTKRTNNTPSAMKQQAKLALEKINTFRPNVLVVIDDNAFREIGLKLVNRKDISIVFSGMNEQPEDYNNIRFFMINRKTPGGNVTGVYEKLYILRSMDVINRSISNEPGNKVISITDFSPTGNAINRQIEIELADNKSQMKWEMKRVRNWQEYVELIQRINLDKEVKFIFPIALTLETSDGRTLIAPEIFKWTVKNSLKPEMALNYYFSKLGLYGGAAVDFESMGFLAGKKAGKILNGEKAGDLPIEDAPEYAIVFNIQRAKDLGIKIPLPLLTAADYLYK